MRLLSHGNKGGIWSSTILTLMRRNAKRRRRHCARKKPVGTVVAVDPQNCTVDIKKRGDTCEIHPRAIFEFSVIGPGSMPDSLFRFGEQISDTAEPIGRLHSARYDLLSQQPPRFHSLALSHGGDIKTVAVELARDLDCSYLAIQGPPGTGMTYVGSHMIHALATAGKSDAWFVGFCGIQSAFQFSLTMELNRYQSRKKQNACMKRTSKNRWKRTIVMNSWR